MDEIAIAVGWAGRTAVVGAAVLALGRAAVLVARPAAARQRIAAGTLRAAVLVPVLALLPAWWVVTVPAATVPAAFAPLPANLPGPKLRQLARADRTAEPADFPATRPTVRDASPDALEPDADAPPQAIPEALPLALTEAVGVTAFADADLPAGDAQAEFGRLAGRAVEVVPEAPTAPDATPPGPTRDDAVALVVVGYAAFALYFLGEFVLGHVALARLRRSSTPATLRVQGVAATVSGPRKSPRVLVHDALASPVCFGVLRPTIVLPAALAKHATAEQLTWVLAHEVEHLRRGDPLTGWFAGAAKVLFFFAPWYWGVRRELRLAQEYLADAAALAAGGHPADYAEFLVNLTADPTRGRRTCLAHGVRAGRSDLSRRITMVLTTNPARGSRRWATPAAAGLLATAVLLSGLTVVRADDKPKEPPAETKPADVRGQEAKARDEALNDARAQLGKLREEAAKVRDEARADAQKARGDAAKVADEAKATGKKFGSLAESLRGDVELRMSDDRVLTLRIDTNRIAKLKGEIEAAVKSGKTDDVMKLVAALEKALTQPAPVPPVAPLAPTPPAVPTPPNARGFSAPPTPPTLPTPPQMAREPGSTLAIVSADPRIADALAALQKAREATKDPEARAAVDRAFKLLRDMPQERDTVVNGVRVPAIGPKPLTFDFSTPNSGSYGLTYSPVPEALAEQLQLPLGTGLLVTVVVADSPFGKAGVKKNDVITKINGTSILYQRRDIYRTMSAMKPGEVASLTVLNKGKETKVEVTVPQPKEALDPAVAAKKKVRFESKSVSVNNDTFKIEAKAGEVEYKITGELAGGKIESYEAKIYEGKDVTVLVQTGDEINLSKTGEKYRPAVQSLLDSVRGN